MLKQFKEGDKVRIVKDFADGRTSRREGQTAIFIRYNQHSVATGGGSPYKEDYPYIVKAVNIPCMYVHDIELVDDFVLPEKWCIKPANNTELKLVYEYGANKNYEAKDIDYYYHYPEFQKSCNAAQTVKRNYTEITFEQFQKYVLKESNMKKYQLNDLLQEDIVVFIETKEQWKQLKDTQLFSLCPFYGRYAYSLSSGNYSSGYCKSDGTRIIGTYLGTWKNKTIVFFNEINFDMEKKIIGYKLIKPEYLRACISINGSQTDYLQENSRYEMLPITSSSVINKLRDACVFDLWFEPVYEEKKVIIAGYTAEKTSTGVKFGCQEFTKRDISAYQRLFDLPSLDSKASVKITIGEVEIDRAMLNKLYNLAGD